MACGESAKSIYKLLEDLGDTDAGRELVLTNLISYLKGQTIEDFVKSFRQDYEMNAGEADDMELNEYVLCMSCQDSHHEDETCSNEGCEETQPPIGASTYFSSLIPRC